MERQEGAVDRDTVDILKGVITGDNSGTDAEKMTALDLLQQIDGGDARAVIEAAAMDSAPAVRVRAARALYHQSGEAASIQLISQIYFQSAASERQAIADLLKASVHPAAQFILQESREQVLSD